jgi:hypothetical protein
MTFEQTREQFLLAYNSNGYLNMCESDDMYNAISSLEKQIPKKPIINKGKIQCVNGHNQPTQHYKYCPMCGQLMDWNDHPTEKGGDAE